MRPGAALGRLHRHPDRGRALRREARADPQRGRPRARLPRRRPQGRPLHRRLDQARPLGRDRDQQERRAGDGPAPARRRRGADPAGARANPAPARSRTCSPSAASATSASRTGRRSTRPRSAAASRTAAPGSSSSGSRRCSTPSARRSPARRGGRRPEGADADDRRSLPEPWRRDRRSHRRPICGVSRPRVRRPRGSSRCTSGRRTRSRSSTTAHPRARGEIGALQRRRLGRRKVTRRIVGLIAAGSVEATQPNADRRPPTILAMANLAELRAMIEAALPGAAVDVSDETGAGDHLRAPSAHAVQGPFAVISTVLSRPQSSLASTTAPSTPSP